MAKNECCQFFFKPKTTFKLFLNCHVLCDTLKDILEKCPKVLSIIDLKCLRMEIRAWSLDLHYKSFDFGARFKSIDLSHNH